MKVLDYFKQVGVPLDRTQPLKNKCITKANVINSNLLSKLRQVDKCTQKYGVTLTFKSRFHNDEIDFLHKLTEKELIKLKCNLIVFPEFTKNGNVHYHGTFWDTYQLPLIKFIKRWKRLYGTQSQLELKIRHYYCGNQYKCCIKKRMLKPKKNSQCWYHYITKDNGQTGLHTIYNYKP